jgi:predicted phage baseplate assembly protein
MLPNTGTVDLHDLSNPPNTYLTLQAHTPTGWPPLFGVSVSNSNPASFDLQVVYNPQAGGITVEKFTNLTLDTADGQIDAESALLTVASFAQTADSNVSAFKLMNFDPADAVPAIKLTGTLNTTSETWTPVQDLLESGESEPVFVMEVEWDGTATLRFGDNVNGKAADSGTCFAADYRIGNGTQGNVGADSLVYLAASDARIQTCRNPLPATGGTDPETNDQIRRRAPQAFLAPPLARAVTMADYEAVTETSPQVDQAVASLRWTGSWYTVFIAVQPKGGGKLSQTLKRSLQSTVERYRMAGQDLLLDSPQYVSLEIELNVCVHPSYFRSDVQQALLQVLGSQLLPNGQKGLFYPDNFTFGQTVYLSPVYAAARSVPGVVSVTAAKFQPQGVNTTQYLTAGEIKLGSLQVARLDNDPSYPDHGQLTLNLAGGK